tara:strand:- start:1304 stop:1861 length:558 start_codon:yes stop_codon:yes gene_type:complete
MSTVGRIFIGISVSFWQLVSLGVFGYALAFLFWPTDVNKLFTVPLPENAVRFIGTTLLFVDAGLNQMVEGSMPSRPIVRQMAFVSSMVQYVLAGAAGLTVVTLQPSLFIREQRIAFQTIYSLFIAALLTRLCRGCVYMNRYRYSPSTQLQSVKIYQVKTTQPVQPPIVQNQRSSGRTIKDIKNGR